MSSRVAGSGRTPPGNPTFVAELAAGRSITEAAKAAGMSERTGRRRAKDPEVQAEVAAARAVLLDAHVERLRALVGPALDSVRPLLRSRNAPTRLGAVKAVLEYHLRFEERRELSARVAELERVLATTGAPMGSTGRVPASPMASPNAAAAHVPASPSPVVAGSSPQGAIP